MEREEGQCFVSVAYERAPCLELKNFRNLAALLLLSVVAMFGLRAGGSRFRAERVPPSCSRRIDKSGGGSDLPIRAERKEGRAERKEGQTERKEGQTERKEGQTERDGHKNPPSRGAQGGVILLLIAAFLLPFLSATPGLAEGYYFSSGMGAGGGAGTYSLSLQSGAMGVDIKENRYMLGVGIPIVPHGYDNIPKDTFDYPCPHEEYRIVGEENDGTELGLFLRAGTEVFAPDLYLSMLMGFTRGTEVQVSESEATGKHYEQASEKKTYWLYGLGLGYFTEVFDDEWRLAFLLDLDNRRGISGSIGFHW